MNVVTLTGRDIDPKEVVEQLLHSGIPEDQALGQRYELSLANHEPGHGIVVEGMVEADALRAQLAERLQAYGWERFGILISF